MKTLKESLLSDIDTSLEQGDKDIKNYNCWGKVFKLDRTVLNASVTKAFSLVNLKKLTKDMDFINDTTAMPDTSYMYAGGDKRTRMFANWVDHINLDDLGLTRSELKLLSNEITTEIRAKIVTGLIELCKKNNIFNNIKSVSVRIVYVKQISSNNQIEIVIWKNGNDLLSVDSLIKFVYEINV